MKIESVVTRLKQTVEPALIRLVTPENLAQIAINLPSRLNFFVVQELLNRTFDEQISDGDFSFLEGRRLQIKVLDAELFVVLSYCNHKIVCLHLSSYPIESDVILSIATEDAIGLIQQQLDPDTLFFQRKLKISGDTDLAHQVKNTIDTLDPENIPQWVLKIISKYNQKVFV